MAGKSVKSNVNRGVNRPSPVNRTPAVKTTVMAPEDREFSIASLTVAWRHTVVYLLEIASWDLPDVAKLVKKKASECAKWANRLWTTGSVDDMVRTGRPTAVTEADLEKVKAAFTTSLPGLSLKVIVQRLQDEGKISKLSEERYRIALKASGWSRQKVTSILPLYHQ